MHVLSYASFGAMPFVLGAHRVQGSRMVAKAPRICWRQKTCKQRELYYYVKHKYIRRNVRFTLMYNDENQIHTQLCPRPKTLLMYRPDNHKKHTRTTNQVVTIQTVSALTRWFHGGIRQIQWHKNDWIASQYIQMFGEANSIRVINSQSVPHLNHHSSGGHKFQSIEGHFPWHICWIERNMAYFQSHHIIISLFILTLVESLSTLL